ncbi:UNVERIFIED_ORG: GNAT superfamily N-acetyltransferase [Methylobacterium sp. SuP10 SLI 274]|uniref:GNAT family N-acetyltransferase n=1 Tax=Methylorubrum extorquens TaxID=408 RepID=UPI0020A20CE3|nr:GNAT family N-acetyltransferase [Methylorubrum extorquens]MDF9862793.1 GNAT superfamily N-acetyltransferase [Methylorubrum pseudosasae]MDH6636404.1 GNAT superfamily N-acetyltransferase [Methylobacterium sp. SuP10 SLI 274]MDH6665584.1 GNAT superfamily N-acetyltransferase [Methylorubrum zatmanii]MCP1557502.1 GNAT superfamily N-acetyltransferase [Methylorubrum extorquens]MDF9791089.1 GNAT superfamily N-acetyltransferase [Methylorubrum extorquens]
MARMPTHRWPPDWFDGDAVVSFDPSVSARMGNWWYDTIFEPFKITPLEFGHRLVAHLDRDDRVEFLSFDRRYRRVSVSLTGMMGNTNVYLAGHTLTLATTMKQAEVDLVWVEDDYQGQGLGATILANLVDLAKDVGASKVVLKAGLDAGPYVWLKFGIFPTDEEWEKVKKPIREKLEGLGRMVTDDARERVEAALASSKGRAIAIIAAEPDLVMSRPASEAPSRDVPLGWALLADSRIRWYGELDFEDGPAMSIFEDYVGPRRLRGPE